MMITGWREKEYSQMGIRPGEAHDPRRYDYRGEYVTIMWELSNTGRSDFNFIEGMDKFGRYIQPLMTSRQHIPAKT